MKIRSLRTAAVLLTCLLGIWVTRAAIQQNAIVSFTQEVQINCNPNETNDVLELSGNLHILITETTDKAGGVVDTFHFQPVNVSAVGTITGDTYNAVGLTRQTSSVSGANATTTFVNNFYMIGQKSGIKSLVHEVAHVTMVGGEVVVTFDKATASCQ